MWRGVAFKKQAAVAKPRVGNPDKIYDQRRSPHQKEYVHVNTHHN